MARWMTQFGGFSAYDPRDLDDNDREQWVQNDEGLYSWWKSTRQPIRTFVRENRARLTEMINAVRNKPPREKTWREY